MKRRKISNKMYFVPGSKIPIAYLIDYIKEGYTLSDFIASYPWLKRTSIEKLDFYSLI